MYGIGELLFGRMNGPLDMAAAAATVLGALLSCAALLLIGRRNDVGWGVALAAMVMPGLASLFAFPAMVLNSPMAMLLYVVGLAVPVVIAVGAALFGLLSFQKLPLSSPMTRRVMLRPFRMPDAVAPVAVAVVYALASTLAIAAIFTGLHAPLAKVPWFSVLFTGFLGGLVPAALVGLAQRSRWAWLLFVVGAVAAIYGTVMSTQGSILIFLYVVLAGLAIAGWQRWGAFTTDASSSRSWPRQT